MTAPRDTPRDDERCDGGSDERVLRCPFCANRWFSGSDARSVIRCPDCDREQWVCAARLCQIGEGEEWTEIVDLSPPAEVIEQVEALEDVSGSAEAGEAFRRAVTLELVFEWESSGDP